MCVCVCVVGGAETGEEVLERPGVTGVECGAVAGGSAAAAGGPDSSSSSSAGEAIL